MIPASCLLLLVLVSLGLAHEPKGRLDGEPSASPEGRTKRDVSAQGLTEDEKDQILALHNTYRGNVSPSASNMVELQWNDELAKDAQDWADQCIFGHNRYRDRQTGQWPWVGQNLAAGTSRFYSVLTFVDWWNNEKKDYNYADNTCEQTKLCGHYTQIVWAGTRFIGCGWSRCSNGWDSLVCNYGPGSSSREGRPYEQGTSCSQCPNGYLGGCSENLCQMS